MNFLPRQKSNDERHDDLVERQSNCHHNPEPVEGMNFIFRCSACGKIFGKQQAEEIIAKNKATTE